MPDIKSIHDSYWLRHQPLVTRFSPLSERHSTEILVIGAGISGLSIALELLERGHTVTICESNVIGSGTTGGSSGHLDANPERGAKHLISQLGEDDARAYIASRVAAIDTIERRAQEGCDFSRIPGYYYSENASDRKSAADELEAAQKLALPVHWRDQVPMPRAACGYRMDSLARIDCMQYLHRLSDLVTAAGGKIYENTLVESPSQGNRSTLDAGDGTVTFDHVVCAVHSNFTDSMRIYMETPPYQSYVIAARVDEVLEDALFWDNSDPYHYVRRAGHADEHLILIGGADHRTGVGDAKAALAQLETWARERFAVQEIVSRWSAEFFEPPDGLPIIGNVPSEPNVWIATGLSGVGLTLGTASAALIADGIENRPNRLAKPLSPSRLALSAAGEILREQLTSVANYAERVLPAKRVDPAELGTGEGTVGSLGGCHVAICRDAQGNLHQHSPICKHMGGVVHWNAAEQTWDCPVHGGRYMADGTRLYGPPQSRLDQPEKKS